jgi:hypothetical protein
MSKPPVDLGAPGRSGDLSRLDPWSFRVLPDGAFGVDSVVVGTTGTFVLLVTGASPGVLPMAKVRRAARRIRAAQSAAGVHLPVHAVLCVQGPPFVPRDRAGVRVIPRLLLVREISERTRVALPHQAERAAKSLRKAAG